MSRVARTRTVFAVLVLLAALVFVGTAVADSPSGGIAAPAGWTWDARGNLISPDGWTWDSSGALISPSGWTWDATTVSSPLGDTFVNVTGAVPLMPTGWTWDGANVALPNGWTWDDSGAVIAPRGWTWDAGTLTPPS